MKKKIIIISVVLLLGVGGVCWYFFRDSNRLNQYEKEWITDSVNKVTNINVVNDENIFGKNGKGIFYSFVNDLGEKYNLKFNNITYKNGEDVTGAMFGVSNILPSGALEFYADHYVYVSKEKTVMPSYVSLSGKTVGILSSNNSYLKKYFENLNVLSKTYDSRDDLINALDNGEVEAFVVPRMEYIDTILEKNYNINYHFSDVKYYYYMNDVSDSRLMSVMKKYFVKWQAKLKENIALEERNEFIKDLKISDKDLVDMQSRDIHYGLVNNSPYETLSSGNVGGIVTDYLKSFNLFSGIDIKYSKHKNLKKLIKKIDSNDVSLFMNYYSRDYNASYIPTNINLGYQVFVYENSDMYISSLDSLAGKKVYVEDNTLLLSELSDSNLDIIKYDREKDWKKIIKNKDSIIIIDENLGNYHSKGDLRKFKKIYENKTNVNYSLVSLNSDGFNRLLSKYINYLDNNTLKESGFYHNKLTEKEGNVISTLAEYSFYFILIIGLILLLIFHNTKKVRIAKKIKKDDKLKYIDQLTSLKNRNYLNENLEAWNKNTIYPQCVIMLDLNKLQEINDTLGYEEGDKQIQGVANVLIRNQLDNTDIIRTDGTEFMIYTVGYNQKQITSYIHKLNKEFKSLPYDYGIFIGYSMILDDLKDISDAINECAIDIKSQKNEQKEEK